MHKFKVKLKITGFELEVEGTKDEVALITSTVSNQLRGMTQPNGFLGENPEALDVKSETVDPLPLKSATKSRKKNGASKVTKVEQRGAIDFKNDPATYGVPNLDWSVLTKGMWILYVVEKILSVNELSASEIAQTFNKHFKQSKTIQPSNVARDFGRVKSGVNTWIGENTANTPSSWYLLDPGKKEIERIIAEQIAK